MKKELCGVCTGSYTGEFSPKWKGPWAHLFDAQGEFLPCTTPEERTARTDRLAELRAQNRVSLNNFSYGW